MKRNLTNLKRKHYRAMKRWMDLKGKIARFNCPWMDMFWYKGCDREGEKLCQSILPGLISKYQRGKEYDDRCPCTIYSYKYIRRVIRTILRNYSHD